MRRSAALWTRVPARSTRLRVQPLGVRGGCCRYRVHSALILVPVSTTRNVASQALPDLGQVLPAAPADPEQTTQAVYIGLGLTLLSFVLTFGVAPRFKSAFKEPETWQEIYPDFMSLGGVESIDPEVAAVKASKGTLLMDIRLNRKFENSTIPNSENFPLYQPISGWGLAANVRRAGFAFFGIYGTERNLNWLTEVEAVVPKGSFLGLRKALLQVVNVVTTVLADHVPRLAGTEIIVACDSGGSLQAKTGADTGFQSQSLKAAYFLKKAGYRNVRHLRGGLPEYRRSVGPLVPGDASAQTGVPAKEESGITM